MLKGKNIILRTIRESDLEELYNTTSNIDERGDYDALFLQSEPLYKARFRENGFWDSDFGTLLITDKTGRILGDITFFKGLKYCEGYEIGYRIYKKENRGKGYMTEALRIFSAYMFSIKPIPRLQVNMFSENKGSRRTAEKCGYKYEGTMRKAVFCKGRYFDLDLLSLMREECPDISEVLNNL